MLVKRLGIDYNSYKLITEQKERNEFLGDINRYVPNFIYSIWNNPKSLAKILSLADKKDMKNNLDHFVTGYLYENIFLSNGNQDQLLYIIAILLKEEINKLENDTEKNLKNFLNETPCGYILEELLQKKEVQSFFKIIIKNLIKNIETIYSFDTILFDPKEISQKIDKNPQNLNEKNKEFEKRFKGKIEQFEIKYIIPLTEKEFEEKFKENKDKDIEIYIKKIISKYKLKPFLYSNEKLFEDIHSTKQPIKTLNYYKQSFILLTYIIDILLESLLKNSNSLHYYMKCIFKII